MGRDEAARLAALTGLARPIQHDINNLLTVVYANLALLKRTAAEGGPQRQIGRIEEATQRLDATLRALLGALRPAGAAPVRLTEILAGLRPLLTLLRPAPGALALDLAAPDAPVLLDRAGFEAALLALAQAVPRGAMLGLAVEVAADGGVACRVGSPAVPALDTMAEFGRVEPLADGLRLVPPLA